MRALLPLLALGCAPETGDIQPLVTPLDGGGPLSVAVDAVAQVGNLEVPVRLLNAYGAAVSGGTVDLQVSGPTASPTALTVEVNGDGRATAEISTAGAEAVLVTVSGSEDGAEVGASAVSYRLIGELPGLQAAWGTGLNLDAAGGDGDASAVPRLGAAATGGQAIALEDRVYYVPAAPGAPAQQAADLPFAVEGVRAQHIDDDLILDLAVWGENQLVLLRGAASGGYAWAGGYQARAGQVVGAAVEDLDSDGYTDLAIATSQGNQGGVQVLLGDGSWGFSPMEPLEVAEEIWSLTAADEAEDGNPDLSLLTAGRGTIKRFSWRPGDAGWVGADTYELVDFEAIDGATLRPQVDLDGDGRLEVIIQGSPDLTPQDLVFYTLTDPIFKYELGYPDYDLGLADLNEDGRTDLLAMQAGRLTMTWNDGDSFTEFPVNLPSGRGPISDGDFAGKDDIRDVMVTTDVAMVYPGEVEDGAWDKRRFAWRAFATALAGPQVVADLNADGVGDIVGITSDGIDTVVGTWVTRTDAGLQLDFGGRLALGGDVDVFGLTPCGNFWYALAGAGSANTLYRFAVVASGQDWVPEYRGDVGVTGSLLTCGDLPNGGSGVVVSTESGFWSGFNYDLTPAGEGNAAQAYDIALGDPDGDGVTEVLSCPTAGCSVAALDLDGDGDDEIVRSEGGVTLEWGDEIFDLGGGGVVSFGDFDSDGVLDVLATDSEAGRIYAWRTLDNGVAPAVVLFTDRTLAAGPAWLSDATGDGIPEIYITDVDSGGNLRTAISPDSTAWSASW